MVVSKFVLVFLCLPLAYAFQCISMRKISTPSTSAIEAGHSTSTSSEFERMNPKLNTAERMSVVNFHEPKDFVLIDAVEIKRRYFEAFFKARQATLMQEIEHKTARARRASMVQKPMASSPISDKRPSLQTPSSKAGVLDGAVLQSVSPDWFTFTLTQANKLPPNSPTE